MKNTDFRVALLDTGLSQKALSERLGVATTTVNRWATGELPVPQYAVAYLKLLLERVELGRRLIGNGLS